MSTNFIGSRRRAVRRRRVHRGVRPPVRPLPRAIAGSAPFPAAAPTDGDRLDGNAARDVQPAARRCACASSTSATDKYGLNAWIFDSTNDGTTNYDKVLFSRTKSAADAVGDPRQGRVRRRQGQDPAAAPSTARPPACSCKVEELTADLSRVRLFHTSVSRAIATLADVARRARLQRRLRGVPRPDVPDLDRRRLRGPRGRASSARRPTSSRASTGRPATIPMLKYVMNDVPPGPAARRASRRPTSSSTSSWASSRPKLPERRGQPGLRRRRPQRRHATAASPQREAFIRDAYQEADDDPDDGPRPRGRQPDDVRLVRSRLRAAVPRDRRQQGRSSTSACCRTPQTSNCRTATGETIGTAKACWAGGALQVYLNVVGRDRTTSRRPARSRRSRRPTSTATVAPDPRRVQGPRRPQRLDPRRQARGLEGHRPDLHQGRGALHPERPRLDRRHGPSDPDRRPRRVRLPALPVRRRDAGHADRAVARSSASTATCRTSRTSRDNINMRATFIAGGPGIAKGEVTARTIDLAPDARATSSASPSPQQSQGRVLTEIAQGRQLESSRSRSSASTTSTASSSPTTLVVDNGINVPGRRRRRSWRRCSTRSSPTLPGAGLHPGRVATTSAPRPPNSGPARRHADDRRRERVGPRRHVARQPRVRLRRRPAQGPHRSGRTSRSSRRTSSRRRRASSRRGSTRRRSCSRSTASRSASSAPSCSRPRSSSRAGATAGLTFLDEAPRIKAESERLKAQGVNVQVVVIHQGTADGLQPDRQRRRHAVDRPDPRRSPTSSRTRRSTR